MAVVRVRDNDTKDEPPRKLAKFSPSPPALEEQSTSRVPAYISADAWSSECVYYGLRGAIALNVLCSQTILNKELGRLVAEYARGPTRMFGISDTKATERDPGTSTWRPATPRLNPLVPVHPSRSKIRVLGNRYAVLIGCRLSPGDKFEHGLKWADLTTVGDSLLRWEPPRADAPASAAGRTSRPTAPLDINAASIWTHKQRLPNELPLDAICVACGNDLFFITTQKTHADCAEFVFQRLSLVFDRNRAAIGVGSLHSGEICWGRLDRLDPPKCLDALPVACATVVHDRYVVCFGQDQTQFGAVMVWDITERAWLDPFDVRVPPPLPGTPASATVALKGWLLVVTAEKHANGTTASMASHAYHWDSPRTPPEPGCFHDGSWITQPMYEFKADHVRSVRPVYMGPYGEPWEEYLDIFDANSLRVYASNLMCPNGYDAKFTQSGSINGPIDGHELTLSVVE